MEIQSKVIKNTDNSSPVKAYATIVLNNNIAIHGFRIIDIGTEEIYRSIISENKELFDISDNRVAQTLAYMMVEADTKDCLYFVPSKELRKNKCCIGESGEESTSL